MSAGDNTLHRGRGRGEVTPRTGLGRPRRWVQERETFFPPAGRLPLTCGAVTFTHGQSMARSNLNHAEWRGGGGVEGSGRARRHQQHALRVGRLRYAPLLRPPSSLCCVVVCRCRCRRGLRCWVSQQGLLGGMQVGHRFLERSAGRVAGGQGGAGRALGS